MLALGYGARMEIGVIVLIVLGALALWTFLEPRINGRPCPRCGHRVTKGVMRCGSCGYDFNESR